MSFVLSERYLVRTFNHVQFKVYGLLKLLEYERLDVRDNTPMNECMITSYHIKTTMFWALENTPTIIWTPERLILCFRLCVVYLRHFLRAKYLPNYFVPNYNLFRKLTNNNTAAINLIITRLDLVIAKPCEHLIGLP